MTEFIIVGRGLAASVLMHAFHHNQISFVTVGSPQLTSCSRVAAGIWNPVVFKRLTKSWLAPELVPFLINFYGDAEKLLGKKLIHKREIIKPFTEDHEKKLWLKKADHELSDFLDERIYPGDDPELINCRIENDYGVVKQSGNLEMTTFLDETSSFFADRIRTEEFDYDHLQVAPGKVVYGDLTARNIIFCEGHLIKHNPWFRWIKLKPAKGETLTIQTEGLRLKNKILNRNGFLMDLGGGKYKVGATYEWTQEEENPTQAGLLQLKAKLRDLIACESTVVSHEAGLRPSSPDRRPLIGAHPLHPNLFLFNGLGTKGVMLAPFFAGNFVNFYLQKGLLHREVNVNRFYHLYEKT